MSAPADRTSGFTLVELMIVATVLVLLLTAFGATAGTASRTMLVTDRRAEATEKLLRFFARIVNQTRAGVLSTYKVEATAADVAAARAAAVGDWIDPVDGEPRDAVCFQAADGILAINAGSLSPPIVLRFRRDAGEDATAGDDDGDGLVDEGQVTLGYDAEVEANVLTGVSACDFVLDGNLLAVRVRTARRVGSDQQFQLEQVFTLRNN
jgi:prepilin-type N-terminal cleavage/methylation domain-containing protein